MPSVVVGPTFFVTVRACGGGEGGEGSGIQVSGLWRMAIILGLNLDSPVHLYVISSNLSSIRYNDESGNKVHTPETDPTIEVHFFSRNAS